MTDNPLLKGVSSSPSPTTPNETRQTHGHSGAAFQALLDDLQEKTRRLMEDGQSASQPAELADAIDRAGASIDDARTLGGQLLEAYRASQQVADTAREEGTDGRRGS